LGNGPYTFKASEHPPGIYCVSGPSASLQINNQDLSTGDGYTFFALNGAKFGVGGSSQSGIKGSVLKFYWPSSCGPRPSTRPSSFSCFGRTISGYDPLTLLYATYTSAGGICAVCLTGNGNDLTGDIFATKPDVFPPGLTDTGGLVSIGGGSLSAGSGFIEAWNLQIAGNTGSYTGTGVPIVIPGGTHTTTDPSTYSTTTTPGTPPVTQTVTTGTTIGMGE
jgi:hypothetical protein